MNAKTFAIKAGVKPNATSAVYFIQAGSDGPIKIGHSNDPFGRLVSLQTGHYEKLRLIGLVSGNETRERALHESFSHLRLEGEWFSNDPAILAAIEHDGHSLSLALEALTLLESLPSRIAERVRVADTQHALDGLLALLLGAKGALDALGVSTGAAQVRLDELWALVDEEDDILVEAVPA